MNKPFLLLCLLCICMGVGVGLLADDYFEDQQSLVIPECPACKCPPTPPVIDWQKAKNIKGGVHIHLSQVAVDSTNTHRKPWRR